MSQLFYLLDIQRNTVDGNYFLNRYWFDNPSSTDTSAESVAQQYVASWMNVVRAIQCNETDHDSIYVKEVLSGTDEFLGAVVGGAGVRSGDGMPDYNQFSFLSKPLGPVIRCGAKRISQVAEGDSNGNQASGTITTFLPIMALLLTGGLDTPETFVYHVITRFIEGTPPSYLVSPVVNGAYRQLSTQRSRLLSQGSSVPAFAGLTAVNVNATDLTGFIQGDYEDIVDGILIAKAAAGAMVEHTYPRNF